MLTGIAVTSGPWLLTTTLLVIMRLSAVAAGVHAITSTERVITVVYAVVVVISAPIDIILTRFSADCVYEERRERIVAPLCRLLTVGIIGFAVVGGIAMAIAQVPRSLAIPGTLLAVIVGTQWLLVSAAGGLSSPGIILKSFAIGPLISVAVWLILLRLSANTTAYLYGFGFGQVVTLGLLLWGTLSALPAEDDESADMFDAVRRYWMMAAAAFAFNAGLWADKLLVLIQHGGHVASQYAALAAVAWLSVIPACAYLFVCVETSFDRRFQAFYQSMRQGASLSQLERRAEELRAEVKQTLLGTAAVQLTVTMLCLAAAPLLVSGLGLGGTPPATVYWLMAGVGLQVVAVSSTLLLYYFDFRREALAAALTQLFANVTFTIALSDTLGAGYAIACVLTSVVSLTLLLRAVTSLLPRTFQSQLDLLESA